MGLLIRNLFLACLIAVTGLAGVSASAQDAAGNELTVAVANDPACWNPIEGPCGADIEFHDLVMDRLLTWDENNQLAPGLATEWSLIDDLTWEFKLRQGVSFTNGEPFNAAAVVFMFDAILNPEGRSAPPTAVGSFRLLDRIDVIDDYTVRFITKEPFPLFARYAAFEPRAVPPQYYAEVGMDEFGLKPIGTGPFKLVEWVKSDHFTLEANAEYWGGAPSVNRVTFRPIPEESTRVAELLSGGVDIASEIPGEMLGDLESSDSARPVTSPSIRVAYINLRASDRLTSLPLREAFFYATNIDVIVDEILGGQAVKLKAGNPVTQFEFGFNADIPDWPYDPDMARQKLEEAGYDGREIQLVYQVGGLPSVDTIAQALQAMWAEVGLNVTIHSEEAGVYNTNWRAGEMSGDIFLNTTGGKAMDSDARLVPHVMCANAETGVGRVSWFCDPAIDAVISQSQVTMDEVERELLLKQAWAMNRDTAHTMSLYAPNIIYGVNNRVQWQPTIEDLYSTLRTAQITQ